MVFGRKWAWFAKIFAGAQARRTLRTPLHEILDPPLLRLTQEHLKEVEDERKSLAEKLFDAEESLHSLKKQLLNAKIQLITSQEEAHDHKMENIRLKQRIQDLENRIDFIFENTIVCSRRRAQSV